MRRTIFLVLSCALLCACGRPPLPKGEQTVRGIVNAAPLSLDRRGTHLLLSGSVKIAYVESTAVNLRLLEGRPAEFIGEFEENIEKSDLPVFVIKSAKALGEESRSWSFASFGISIRAPLNWVAESHEGRTTFTQTGSSFPLLTIRRQPYDASPFVPKTATGASSSSAKITPTFAVISSFRIAWEKDLINDVALLTVDLGASPTLNPEDRTLLFTFSFPSTMPLTERERILDLVSKSIKVSSLMPSSSGSNTSRATTTGTTTSQSATSATSGSPVSACGGAAGILCPAGYYCAITDTKENIGKCVKR